MKSQEAQNYKNENAALYQENERYRGLIETLLRHPAFTPFIDDISKNPAALGLGQPQQQAQAPQPMQTSQQQTPVQQQPQQQPPVEDSKPDFLNFDASQVQIPTQQNMQQSNEQVGLSMIPEENFSKLNLGGFGQQQQQQQQMNFNNFKQVNAYAVTSLPQGPDPVTLLADSAARSPVSSARRAGESASLVSSDSTAAATSADFSVLLAKLDGTAKRMGLGDHDI